ncbi:MAG: lpxD [Hydrocarboniphaga sp.]|uniref:UDP-3-O-(3-hydroxymyristoyl)glucosamine N-acyltransferase n=1 Tax=Hydrocarboniphaga sp. TaxID=2033016 RepID=UPI00260C66AB|nr:UDP-3-O-(3-hydroxymyristoyl)glucosamine N-acyltransferase [Hydrocarboniphaga sp.]MDB5968967.1 lpxD [Hydrocarboniphaga sp.]
MSYSLGELAQRFGLEVAGDPAALITGVCTLAPGEPGRIGFLANPRYRSALAQTRAGAVVVGRRDVADLAGNGLVAKDPYRAFAQIARLFDVNRDFVPGVHPTAVVAADAVIGQGVHIAAQAVIESGAQIGDGSYIGPACIVGVGAVLGAGARLEARVYIHRGVHLGLRCQIQPGAVIGSRGFGNVMGPAGWEEVPQLGSVLIGDDVEIGANTTIDRGAIDDTLIANGVRLDNLIMIAHNCRIGEHTAIAACTGIAGSTTVGARCMIGGAVGINGHIEIADDVVILGRAMVTTSLLEKGVYGSGLPIAPAREWRKSVARVRRLGKLEERVRSVEQKIGIKGQDDGDDGQDQL